MLATGHFYVSGLYWLIDWYIIIIIIMMCSCWQLTYLSGSDRSPLRRSNSLCGTLYQRKFIFQLNPPHVMSDPVMYSNVSSLITSMIGQITIDLRQKQHSTQPQKTPDIATDIYMWLITKQNCKSELLHLSWWISWSSGSSHPSVHSQCASRNVITWPFDSAAPTSHTVNDASHTATLFNGITSHSLHGSH